jgi:hypothetical protein
VQHAPESAILIASPVSCNISPLDHRGTAYSGHSFRAGGATDLFDAGVDLVLVRKFGRWKTAQSALCYYRSSSRVSAVATRAFARGTASRSTVGIHWGQL